VEKMSAENLVEMGDGRSQALLAAVWWFKVAKQPQIGSVESR
jgi:hypothetical protein